MYSSDTEGREPGTIEFRSGSQIYIIRDKGILAEARKLLQPMEELGRQQSQLGEKQAALGKAQTASAVGSIDDLPVFGGGGFSEPAVIVPTMSRQSNNKLLYIMISAVTLVAIAAIAQGSVVYIAIGLALSIPMLIWGSNLIRELLDESGLLVLASGAFLGWVAGGVAVADPLVVAPISAYAPALSYAIPAACAIFVLWQNLILDPRRARLRGSHAE